MNAAYRQWHALPTMQAGDMYRFPRTVVEAYPNDASHEVHTAYEPMPMQDKVMTVALSVVLLGILAAMAWGWL